jgi:hypothetical protein
MNWRRSWKNAEKKARKKREKNIIPPPDSSVWQWRQLTREDKIAYLQQHVGKLVIFRPQNYLLSPSSLKYNDEPMMLISVIVGNGKYIQFRFLQGNTFRDMVLDNDQITEWEPALVEWG